MQLYTIQFLLTIWIKYEEQIIFFYTLEEQTVSFTFPILSSIIPCERVNKKTLNLSIIYKHHDSQTKTVQNFRFLATYRGVNQHDGTSSSRTCNEQDFNSCQAQVGK